MKLIVKYRETWNDPYKIKVYSVTTKEEANNIMKKWYDKELTAVHVDIKD